MIASQTNYEDQMNRYVSSVIPVLDLMIGQVVWAKSGNRGSYSPVCSPLTNSAQPVDVALAVYNQTGCDCLYLANIDSFAGAPPISVVYDQLLEAGFSLWIDADWMGSLHCDKRTDEILSLAQKPNVKLIFSSETLSSWDEFSIIAGLAQSGANPIFSLDLRGGKVITKSDALSSTPPLEMITKAWQSGVKEMIVLDLESVGTYHGVSTEKLIGEVAEKLPGVRLTSGGGVRNQEDAQRLLSAGCQHVLVASAIFDCKFTPDDVANLTPFKPCSLTTLAMTSKPKNGVATS
jgi:phosphoribosylformimino-5-aminoimidazole carboxamide ribotide isomerase